MAATDPADVADAGDAMSMQVDWLLADELVVSILEFLGLADLRAAAAVGRQFYRSAWLAGLYIERKYYYDEENKDPQSEVQTQTWTDLVEHALRKQLRLALTFDCLMLHGAPVDSSAPTRILRAISRSLPVLVALSITVRYSMLNDVYAALQHPAPRLRTLRLSRYAQEIVEGMSIPKGLFSGDAPRLCELGLGCLVEDTRAIPAFANVVRLVTVSVRDSARLSLGFHFPKLAHMYIYSGGTAPDVPPTHLDLTGVTLRTLVFNDICMYARAAAKRKTLGGRHVPVVHHLLHHPVYMDWHCPLGWANSGVEIHLRLNIVGRGLSVLVQSEDRVWRRSYMFRETNLGSPLPLRDMPRLCARLAYLWMHSDAVVAFLQCAAEFSSLARVRVDVLPAPDEPIPLFRHIAREQLEQEPAPRVRCPALAVLALAAQSREMLIVGLRDVAFLCRALGAAVKPELELCCVAVQCGRGGAPQDLFSRVIGLPDGDAMPCAQFDSGVWDDHAAIMSENYVRQSLAQ